jgi:hypothetical protein
VFKKGTHRPSRENLLRLPRHAIADELPRTHTVQEGGDRLGDGRSGLFDSIKKRPA